MLKKNRLKELREANKLSQETLANQLQVSRQTIISIEKGRYIPSLTLAIKIAKTFEKPIEDIFGVEE